MPEQIDWINWNRNKHWESWRGIKNYITRIRKCSVKIYWAKNKLWKKKKDNKWRINDSKKQRRVRIRRRNNGARIIITGSRKNGIRRDIKQIRKFGFQVWLLKRKT